MSVPPGLPALPLVGWRGNAVAFARDPLRYLIEAQTRGPITALADTHAALVFAFGPQHNEALIDDPTLRRYPPALGSDAPTLAALLDQPSDATLVPLLDQPLLAAHHATIVMQTAALADRWGIGQVLDVAYVADWLALAVARRLILGSAPAADELARRLHDLTWLLSLPTTLLPELHWTARLLVRQRRLALLADQIETGLSSVIDQIDPAQPPNVLAQLAQRDAAPPTARGLIGSVFALWTALHPAMALGVTWTMLLLSQHPSVLGNLLDELRPLRGAPPALDQLDRLQLLDYVIRESVRLLPPCAIGLRTRVTAWQLGSYDFAPGTIALYSPFTTHHLSELYVTPLQFRPARWQFIEPGPWGYLPFGGGLFDQIGMQWALPLIKLVLATLLPRYQFGLAPGVSIDRGRSLLLTPRTGLPMVIAPPDRTLPRRRVNGNIRELVALG